MDDKAVLERLLEVLNRIDERLKSIETSVANTKARSLVHVEDVESALGTALGPALSQTSAASPDSPADLGKRARRPQDRFN
jgi:hypothetical protein